MLCCEKLRLDDKVVFEVRLSEVEVEIGVEKLQSRGVVKLE